MGARYRGFSPAKALLHCVKCMDGSIKNMTIPSQTRYLAYLTKILMHRQCPRSNPLMVQRVILHRIPVFEVRQQRVPIANTEHSEKENEEAEAEQSEKRDMSAQSPSLLSMNTDAQTKHKHSKPSSAQFMIGSIDDDEEEEEEEVADLDHDEELELGQNIDRQIEAQNAAAQNATVDSNSVSEHNTDESSDKAKQQKVQKEREKEKEISTVLETRRGLRPYIQIFKNAKLVFSSRRKSSRLRFYDESEGHIKFEVNKEIMGDVLVRIRHLSEDEKGTESKVSVCRFAFHTGYLETEGVIRFKKTQLDGAWNSKKFAKDFWIDLLLGAENTSTMANAKAEQNALFWANITQRESRMAPPKLKPIEVNTRFSVLDDENNEDDDEVDMAEQEKEQEVVEEEEPERERERADEAEEEALSVIRSRMEQKEENEQSLLDEMDAKSKEVMDSMTHLMAMTEYEMPKEKDREKEEEQEVEEEADKEKEEEEDEVVNAEEDPTSTIDTFGDLEQFADGLDLDNVEVDSDTEQNFEMLLEELNDDTVHEKEQEKEAVSPVANELDLP